MAHQHPWPVPGPGGLFAGLIISESEYSEEALGHILPFRDLFISFFFVSIGMLLDTNFVFGHPGEVLFFTCLVLFGKTLIGALTTYVLRYPLKQCFSWGSP